MITLENLALANGRILIEKTEYRQIYKVLKVAQNVNYEGLKEKINAGDFVCASEFIYLQLKIDDKVYYVIKPSEIYGVFK